MNHEFVQRSTWHSLHRRVWLCLRAFLNVCAGPFFWAGVAGAIAPAAQAAEEPRDEYQLKAAYIYNFATFTEWPAEIGATITLCIYGPDPFGEAIDAFQDSDINGRSFRVRRINTVDQLAECQIVFISNAVIANLARVLDETDRKFVLSIADSPAAALAGAGINMVMDQDKIGFEVNLASLRKNGLDISFQLLRLARKVYQ